MTEEETAERRRFPCPRRRPFRRLLPDALRFFTAFCNLWFRLLCLGPFPHTQPQLGPLIPLRMTWSRFIATLFVSKNWSNYVSLEFFLSRGRRGGSPKNAAGGRRVGRAAAARVRSVRFKEQKIFKQNFSTMFSSWCLNVEWLSFEEKLASKLHRFWKWFIFWAVELLRKNEGTQQFRKFRHIFISAAIKCKEKSNRSFTLFRHSIQKRRGGNIEWNKTPAWQSMNSPP